MMVLPGVDGGDAVLVVADSGGDFVVRPEFWLVAVPVLFVVLFGRAIMRARTEPRFLRFAEGLVTLLLIVAAVAVALEIATFVGDPDSTTGTETLQVSRGDVTVQHESGTRLTHAPDRYERQWLDDQFGGGARLVDGTSVETTSDQPSFALLALSVTYLALLDAIAIGILVLVKRMLGDAIRGRPFDPVNPVRLQRIGLFLMAGWTASQFLLPAIARAVVHSAGGRGDFSFGVDVSLLLAAAFVFALAEIWRSGVRIQDDVEATV